MSALAAAATPLAIAAVTVASIAVLFAARLARARRRAPRLPPPLADPPRVQVLLPVRDEEENVAAALAALAAQTAPVEIRVLDDGSTDSTAEIVRRFATDQRTPRVELVRVPAPATGRSGKIHALTVGAEDVTADWILAIDADARPARDTLARALAAAAGEGLDAISLAARQRVGSPGEALLTPLVFALLDALLGDWAPVAAGRGAPVANGQFFLVRRAALAVVGGYASIAREPLDDVALARRLAAAGFRVGFWRAGEALEVRMYSGFGATFRGWRRNLALILGARPGVALAAATLSLLPALLAVASLVSLVSGGSQGSATGALIGFASGWLGGALASCIARAGTGSSPLWGVVYPLDALALAAALAAALFDSSRGRLAPWRGRTLEP